MEFGGCGLKGQKWEVVAFFAKKFPLKEQPERMSRCQTKEFLNEGRAWNFDREATVSNFSNNKPETINQ